MFTLDVSMPEVKVALFAHGSRVVADIDIWHKRSWTCKYAEVES